MIKSDLVDTFKNFKFIEDSYVKLMNYEKERLDRFMKSDKLKSFVKDQQDLLTKSREMYNQYLQIKKMLIQACEDNEIAYAEIDRLENLEKLRSVNEIIQTKLIEQANEV